VSTALALVAKDDSLEERVDVELVATLTFLEGVVLPLALLAVVSLLFVVVLVDVLLMTVSS